ncbi:chaperone protein dnaJ 8, chloroplastic-like [Triticum aestivum]|uniref:chaperone protein dnaJ 8, chloroplastic-like n=1 Tax=Triticum aestivum TaxID=4565 RepID=UPI001D00FE7E|nr:chaperone protein dnaJ 8, chloroplastic-like [Triticum aestivum]
MATGGGVVLNLRVPSASVAPARRCGTASSSVRCGSARGAAPARHTGGALEEDHYRTLRLAPGATRGEVKRAFHRLALQYHPDVVQDGHQDDGVDFERINAAYQRVMSNMREAEARLEYWRRRYGLADEDLDRYRHYLNEEDEDDWFADL